MAARDPDVLASIEHDVLTNAPLADALRKCILLGGKAGSVELREWATRELRGYDTDDPDVPAYRTVPSLIYSDGFIGGLQVSGHSLSVHELPDITAGRIEESFTFYNGVGSLEALAVQATETEEGFLKLSLPGAVELARLMDALPRRQLARTTALYWKVSSAALTAILDQVRTSLAELVAEMRAGLPKGEHVPSAELATQAVNVAVHGKRSRVTVNTAQASGQATAEVTDRDSPEDDGPFWTVSRKVGAAVVGAAGIVVAVITVIQFAR